MEEVTFSSSELLVLISKYSPSVVLGFKDPVSGFLAEEILEFYEQGMASLTIRNIAHVDVKHQLVLHSLYDNWIETICNPQHSILMGHYEKGIQEISAFHFRGKSIINLSSKYNQDQERYKLRSIPDSDTVFEMISKPFYTNFYIDRDETFTDIENHNLEKVTSYLLNNKADLANQILTNSGLPEEKSALFLSALSFPTIKLTVAAYHMRDGLEEPKKIGFAVIARDGDLWLIKHSYKKDCVNLLLGSKAALEDYIKSAIPSGELV